MDNHHEQQGAEKKYVYPDPRKHQMVYIESDEPNTTSNDVSNEVNPFTESFVVEEVMNTVNIIQQPPPAFDMSNLDPRLRPTSTTQSAGPNQASLPAHNAVNLPSQSAPTGNACGVVRLRKEWVCRLCGKTCDRLKYTGKATNRSNSLQYHVETHHPEMQDNWMDVGVETRRA